MQRTLLGIIAMVSFSLGLFAALGWWQGESAEQIGGSALRIGIMLAAICLALPQLRRLPPWLPLAVMVAGVIVAWRPKLLIFVVPVLIALWFLRPRGTKANSSSPIRSERR